MARTMTFRATGLTVAFVAGLFLNGCQTTGLTRDKDFGVSIESAAVAAERNGDFAMAATHYNKLRELRGDDLQVLLNLARNMRYAGGAETALKILNDAAKTFSAEPAYLIERGKVEVAANKSTDAVSSLNKALKISPKDWQIYATLGIAYDLATAFSAAEDAYAKALQLSPENPTILNNMAISAALAGNLDKAITTLEEAPTSARQNPQIRQNLAMFYGLKGEIGKAENLARRDLDEASVRRNLSLFARLRGQTTPPAAR